MVVRKCAVIVASANGGRLKPAPQSWYSWVRCAGTSAVYAFGYLPGGAIRFSLEIVMAIDQFDVIVNFCIRVGAMMIITIGALKMAQLLARPRGTYGAGLPERRARPRLALGEPDAVFARLRATSHTQVPTAC